MLRDREIQRLRDQIVENDAKIMQREWTAEDMDAKEREEAQAKQEEDKKSCSFFFVDAAKLRSTEEKTLPAFQELCQRQGWIQKHEISASLAYRHRYVDMGFLAVSHRWEFMDFPDEEGKQLEALIAHLRVNIHIKWVWYDYWCMPQGKERTPAEKVAFGWMLKNVNLLYIGSAVLLLVDNSYTSRFWV